jgi:hypothetical protein
LFRRARSPRPQRYHLKYRIVRINYSTCCGWRSASVSAWARSSRWRCRAARPAVLRAANASLAALRAARRCAASTARWTTGSETSRVMLRDVGIPSTETGFAWQLALYPARFSDGHWRRSRLRGGPGAAEEPARNERVRAPVVMACRRQPTSGGPPVVCRWVVGRGTSGLRPERRASLFRRRLPQGIAVQQVSMRIVCHVLTPLRVDARTRKASGFELAPLPPNGQPPGSAQYDDPAVVLPVSLVPTRAVTRGCCRCGTGLHLRRSTDDGDPAEAVACLSSEHEYLPLVGSPSAVHRVWPVSTRIDAGLRLFRHIIGSLADWRAGLNWLWRKQSGPLGGTVYKACGDCCSLGNRATITSLCQLQHVQE